MSEVKAAEIKIFSPGPWKDGGQNREVCETGGDVSWFDFLCVHCPTDVLFK